MGRDQEKRRIDVEESTGPRARCGAFFRRRAVLVAGITVGVLLLAAAAGGIWWVSNVKAPDIPDVSQTQPQKDPDVPEKAEEEGLGSLTEGVALNEELPDYISNQKEGVYTFLLIGRTTMDDNSDMLMLIVFDTNTGKIDAVSIPRDTMINVSTGARKINQAIWGGVDYTKNWVRKTLGVYPNFYVMVDWAAVGQLVDAVGGVYFDVPCRMYYVDSNKVGPFKIDLEPGYQHLDGNKAMQLIRWRKNASGYEHYAQEAGFDGSNTKRTQMQQEFMVEAAKQILQVKNVPYLGSMVQVFTEYVETDLSTGNLAWFAQKALSLDSAHKVTFHTLPANYSGSAYCSATRNMQSYVTIQQTGLLEMVNTYLNPYESRITLSNLDLMRINSDGTISSSTGSVADAQHNQLINDVNSGLAYFADNGAIVYKKAEETETDPEQPGTDPSVDPGGTGEENPAIPGTDPGSDGGETAPDPSVPGTEPQNPGPDGADPGDSSADPVSPEDGNGSTEQSGSEPSTTGSETASGGEGVTAPEQDSAQNEENGAL